MRESRDNQGKSRENDTGSPINGLFNQALHDIKTYVDMDTLIGSPLAMGENTLAYPIIKVTVGVMAGGGQYANKLMIKKSHHTYPFAGGTGAGFTAEPVGFLVVSNGKHDLITIQNENAWANTISKVGDGLNEYLKKLAKNQAKSDKKE